MMYNGGKLARLIGCKYDILFRILYSVGLSFRYRFSDHSYQEMVELYVQRKKGENNFHTLKRWARVYYPNEYKKEDFPDKPKGVRIPSYNELIKRFKASCEKGVRRNYIRTVARLRYKEFKDIDFPKCKKGPDPIWNTYKKIIRAYIRSKLTSERSRLKRIAIKRFSESFCESDFPLSKFFFQCSSYQDAIIKYTNLPKKKGIKATFRRFVKRQYSNEYNESDFPRPVFGSWCIRWKTYDQIVRAYRVVKVSSKRKHLKRKAKLEFKKMFKETDFPSRKKKSARNGRFI